ncbi:FxLYD domain-containing protein [Halococcus thailandensis]|uniref:Uncharacterized protein n=1 Tax=Halococcus thailandensis JCM 13552 TaxID=1227457 RepID=M0MSI5_9EURY|nr:FxLYD domain-containing protein [Halococcus thailandensis]EMA48697.1 hypothetical protein C451_20063 [Halococcus thailandensis JCM 13552]
MHRRRYLTAIGLATATTLAGCSGSNGEAGETTSGNGTDTGASETATRTTVADTDTANITETASGDDETATDSPEPAPDGEMRSAASSSQLTVTGRELAVNADQDIPSAVVGATVENAGPMTGEVVATATFYNGDGEEIATGSNTIAALPSGEEWLAPVIQFGDGAETAEDYEYTVEYSPTAPKYTTDGLEEISSELDLSDGAATVTGEIENTSGSPIEQLTATMFLYVDDASERLYTTLQDSTDSLASGDSWNYRDKTDAGEAVVSQETRYSYES